MTDPTLMSAAEYRRQVADSMPEAVLQEQVRQVAQLHGWRYYHTHRSDRSPAGFPDTVLLRRDRLIFAELKRQAKRYKPSPAQQAWLDDLQQLADFSLSAVGAVEVYVWRPLDMLDGTIAELLR